MSDIRWRIMLVDDHAIVRAGFRLLLESAAQAEVIAEADSGEQAIAWLDAHAGQPSQLPDLIVLDVAMPGMGGHAALRAIKACHPQCRVLGFSAHEEPSHIRQFLQGGGDGYLCKRSAPELLVQAVRAVLQGQRYVDPLLAPQLVQEDVAAHRTALPGADARSLLSPREFEVFLALAAGDTVQDVAERLHVSASTAGTHLYNIKQKLGLRNQAEMTLLAIRQGWLDAT
ncbi:hypothetical protein AAV94_11400 [Lampropedia cohaerens]|uniref:LuxR family transcriptional regulator n=1 Tax=Lampropedia cohaerens TaxID=1610491 RepID=A0A0U1PYI2_9BURK|nr:response regulator transcription factor [Lampropedia cohaerens]KKW67425.1 hypothetical protein AAV94_11400 [Lampropedia cohaerens]